MSDYATRRKQALAELDPAERAVFDEAYALQDYVESDQAGRGLKPFLDLIDAHGAEAVIAAVDALVPAVTP
ncbi:MAG: hypothetical protein PHQ28_01010 [Mycobacterium sp.]|nr:hypothetical protein [Mycobacterium sp.]